MARATPFFRITPRSTMSRLLHSVTFELAWIILALSLGITVLTYCFMHDHAQRMASEAMRQQALQGTSAIKARLDISAQLLRNTAAMLQLNRTVQNTTWQQYQQNLAHQGWPAAMRQLGYAQRIAASEKTALSTAMRADAMPDYQIHPSHDQPAHAPILFAAPETGQLADVRPGFDLLWAPATQRALHMAIDSGSIGFHALDASEPTRFVTTTTKAARALLVLPIFPGSAVPPTVDLRRQQVIGFVFAFINIDELIRTISTAQYPAISLIELPAQPSVAASDALTLSGGNRIDVSLDLYGSRWQASITIPRASVSQQFTGSAEIVALCGVITSALLFAVLRFLAAIQLTNRSQSRRASREIKQLEHQLSALIGCSDHAIIKVDRRQRIISFNAAAESMFGVSSVVAIGIGLARFLPHKLHGAKRIERALPNASGLSYTMYRLQNNPNEPACRYHGEHFPFEATIFKCAQWGQAGTLILLKDLTDHFQIRSVKSENPTTLFASSLSQPRLASELQPVPRQVRQLADAEDLQAMHFEITVGESVCDAKFKWLTGNQCSTTQGIVVGKAHAAAETSQLMSLTLQMSVNEFITTRIHADDRAAVKQQWKNAFRTGCDIDCIYRLLLADDKTQVVRHWMTSTGWNESGRRFAGLLHELQQDPLQPMSTSDSRWVFPLISQQVVDQPTEPKSTRSALSDTDRAKATRPVAARMDRRRRDPNTIETGRLYRQLKCRIMLFDSAHEAQQKRLAREMHDDFGQLLSAMKMDVVSLQAQLAKVDHRLSQQLGDVGDLVDAMVVSVRRIIANLPPQQIDQHGLIKALEMLTGAHSRRHQISCRLHVSPQLPPIDNVMITPIYRIVQEALNNVAKHARATEVEICIEHTHDRLSLRVTDNGNGIATSTPAGIGGFGLIGMRERVTNLHGQMTIDTSNGVGTTIRISIPLDVELAS